MFDGPTVSLVVESLRDKRKIAFTEASMEASTKKDAAKKALYTKCIPSKLENHCDSNQKKQEDFEILWNKAYAMVYNKYCASEPNAFL